MEQFKSWTLRKCDFSIADQRLTVHVREFYRTLLGQTPISVSCASPGNWGLPPIFVGHAVCSVPASPFKGKIMEYAQTNKVPSSVEEIPSSTEERMRNMRATMEQYVNTASQRAREAAAYADRRVQQNPWSAVGIAAGVGLVLGLLIRRS